MSPQIHSETKEILAFRIFIYQQNISDSLAVVERVFGLAKSGPHPQWPFGSERLKSGRYSQFVGLNVVTGARFQESFSAALNARCHDVHVRLFADVGCPAAAIGQAGPVRESTAPGG
jgi:hypothetical protein